MSSKRFYVDRPLFKYPSGLTGTAPSLRPTRGSSLRCGSRLSEEIAASDGHTTRAVRTDELGDVVRLVDDTDRVLYLLDGSISILE